MSLFSHPHVSPNMYFLLWNMIEYILKNVGNQTFQFLLTSFVCFVHAVEINGQQKSCFPTFFKIYFFMVDWIKQLMGWNHMRLSKWWLNFHFWVNTHFNTISIIILFNEPNIKLYLNCQSSLVFLLVCSQCSSWFLHRHIRLHHKAKREGLKPTTQRRWCPLPTTQR